MKGLRRKWIRRLAGALAFVMLTGQIAFAASIPSNVTDRVSAALALAEADLDANGDSVRMLIEACVEELDESDPVCSTLQSILILMDTGNADAASVAALLRNLLDSEGEMPPAPTPEPEPAYEPEPTPEAAPEPASEPTERESRTGLPVFEVNDYIRRIVRECVLVDVPGDWGNNGEAGRALTTYSPVNDSGAISPSAGTLSLSYFPADGEDEETAFETYERNIALMSVATDVSSKDAVAAGLKAKTVEYIMNVGANQFICETICFAYDDMIYSIELMQGSMSDYDYFPVYQKVVDSTEIGSEEEIEEAEEEEARREAEPTPEGTPEPTPEVTPEPTPEPTPEAGGIESFRYTMNGHSYEFPTPVGSMGSDLPIDLTASLPYNMFPEKAVQKGKFAEIINTEYFVLPSPFFKEMAAVTNMVGHEVPMTDGILTVLIDTGGDAVDVTLPGGLHVGSPEEDIIKGFPAFGELSMDGVAGFVGNELVYACNVRDDGCNGYVIIRNDAPYFSSISIICENNTVREITFECLGSVRAAGIFL